MPERLIAARKTRGGRLHAYVLTIRIIRNQDFGFYGFDFSGCPAVIARDRFERIFIPAVLVSDRADVFNQVGMFDANFSSTRTMQIWLALGDCGLQSGGIFEAKLHHRVRRA